MKRILVCILALLMLTVTLPLSVGATGSQINRVEVCKVVDGEAISFDVQVPEDGTYCIGMSYRALDEEIQAIEVSLEIDGELPFSEAKKLSFPRMWTNENSKRIDGLGNEFTAKQIPYGNFYFNLATDITKRTADPYQVKLSAGTHNVQIIPVTGKFELEYFAFKPLEELKEYQTPENGNNSYSGKPIIIEGEDAYLKNSYWLNAKSDNSSVTVTPNDTKKSIINYIGGSSWVTQGDTITWKTEALTAGYYGIALSFRQSTVLGGKVYRSLLIDGKVPFAEAKAIGFSYDNDWQQIVLVDDNNEPYRFYFSEGEHDISLSVSLGEMGEVCTALDAAVSDMGAIYSEITMITGETVDTYRDYELFSQIPNMESRLKVIQEKLTAADEKMQEITGESSGSQAAVIKNAERVVESMLDNRHTAHRYKSEYYTRYTALAATLGEMRNMPLDIDKIALIAPKEEKPFETKGFFSQLRFSVEKFLVSFGQDYNNISGTFSDSQPVTVWVNWGRDQAQVLNSLSQSSFTKQTGIAVDVQLVNASIIQAVLSGKGPDVILQQSRSEPVNLAMRGVLYDLSEFDDLNEVLARFQEDAEVPYKYKDGLYALPDTQIFYVMFYRKDILEQLGLTVPETWDDFKETTILLARRNLQVWMPNNVATDLTQVNVGIGSINLFPTLLMQKGLNIYSEDGKTTNLTNSDIIVAFNEWTDYYRKLRVPKTMDFYNRFRTGVTPIGISTYTTYATIKAAAPEIDGLWGVAPIPGTKLEDGTVSRLSTGGGTGCAILSTSKNPKNAWEFLKWWTNSETQLSYSNEIESLLGATGRIAVSNIEAFKGLSWDSDMLTPILEAWSQVREVPEYPGSYYVSRSLYQSFWNVVEKNENPKDMLLKYGDQANKEIQRKWQQYENRGN